MSSDTATAGRPIQIPLIARKTRPINDVLGKLARFCKLDVYQTDNLEERARNAMGYAALILSIIFVFDFFMWTLLFNFIFHNGWFQPSLFTVLAIFLGLLLSGATFIYERQFLTADTSQVWFKKIFPYSMRIILVFAAALITSQPFELLLFKSPINARLHQENIRLEAVNLFYELERNKDLSDLGDEKVGEKLTQTLVFKNYHETKGNIDATRGSLREAGETLNGKKRELEKAKASFSAMGKKRDRYIDLIRQCNNKIGFLERRLESYDYWDEDEKEADQSELDTVTAERAGLERANKKIQKKINNTDARIVRLKDEIHDLNYRIPNLEQDLGVLEQSHNETRDSLFRKEEEIAKNLVDTRDYRVNSQQRYRDWVGALLKATPGDIIYEFGEGKASNTHPVFGEGRFYVPPQHDFFQQLRVLQDLRFGLPPKWPDIPQTLRQQIITEFQALDYNTKDPVLVKRRKMEARTFDQSYWLVFGIAVFLPMLVFIYKFLYPEELISYYSSAYQNAARQTLRYTIPPQKNDTSDSR